MTAEMGNHSATPTLRQRVAGISVVGAVAVMNYLSDDSYGRYDRATARLSLYGESEDAGDEYERGRDVSAVTGIAMLGPVLPCLALLYLGRVITAVFGPVVALPVMLVGAIITLYAMFNVVALQGLGQKIGVVDHTTPPAPDALDELQREYVDGEIDEAELDERAAEVWDR